MFRTGRMLHFLISANLSRSYATQRPLAFEHLNKRLGHIARYEVAQPDDFDIVCSTLCEEFCKSEPTCVSLGLTPQELQEYAAPIVKDSLKQPYTLLVYVKKRLVSVLMSREVRIDRSKHVPMEIRKDYKEVIDAVGFSTRRCSQWSALMYELENMVSNVVPTDVKHVFQLEMGVVIDEFKRFGIVQYAAKNIADRAKRSGLFYVDSSLLSKGMQLATKEIVSPRFTLPYNEYRDGGELVHKKPMFDGTTGAIFGFGELKKFKHQKGGN